MAPVLKTPRKIAPTSPQPFEWPRRGATQEHLLTAKTLDGHDVDDYCAAAEALEAGRMKTPASAGKAVALLFFQPSTRTRMGFEAAAVALGASTIGVDDMTASRSNTRSGETWKIAGQSYRVLAMPLSSAIMKAAPHPALQQNP
jgi:aspartate carbamoyltransferase catalytic subunit